MKLIGLEDLANNFKIIKTENRVACLKLYKGRYVIRVEFPFEANEKLASLFGHVLGDGCIKSKEESVHYTNKNKDLIEEFKSTIKELFGIKIRENFNKTRKFYETYTPKTVAKFLVLCGFPKGEKTKQAITIPDWIKEGSNEIKATFIRALFDDDSTVINSKGNYAISFGMNKKKSLLEVHKVFMEDIRKILFSLGIYPNEIFKRRQLGDFIQLGFHIYGRYSLIKFLENIGFTHEEKQEKLIKAIKSYKTYGKNETKMRILNALKTNTTLRTRDLCKIVNRDRKIVWKNVHKLVEEDLVEKVLVNKKGSIEKVLWKLKTES